MSALRINTTLNEIEETMSVIAPYRRSELFTQFLMKGYTAFTLDTVPQSRRTDLLRAKLCLGTLITVYDDFADRPTQADPLLLENLYRLNFGKYHLNKIENVRNLSILNFAERLFVEIEEILKQMPNYNHLIEILRFDMLQFYSANQYSSLLTANPNLNNILEKTAYSHHNMGMILASMMDLIAIEDVQFSELGALREIFCMGQRMGRIFNVLATYKRELADGDITGDLSSLSGDLEVRLADCVMRQEVCTLQRNILKFENQITSFSVLAYVEALKTVQNLHEKMEGVI